MMNVAQRKILATLLASKSNKVEGTVVSFHFHYLTIDERIISFKKDVSRHEIKKVRGNIFSWIVDEMHCRVSEFAKKKGLAIWKFRDCEVRGYNYPSEERGKANEIVNAENRSDTNAI